MTWIMVIVLIWIGLKALTWELERPKRRWVKWDRLMDEALKEKEKDAEL